MKSISRMVSYVAAVFIVGTNASRAEDSQKQMLKEAKVDRTHAEVIALGRARGGKIKSSEIEREHGRLVWSFDIEMPNTRDITEVQVDAKTAKIVAVEKENPAQQAKEAKNDRAQKH